MKSLIAAPSRRNSGFEATLKRRDSPARASSSATQPRTREEVPTGTVLLVTITL